MHYAESPWALTEHAAEATGQLLFHTKEGMALLHVGLFVGILAFSGYILYRIGKGILGTRSKVQKLVG